MLSISHLLIGQGPDGQRNYIDMLTSTEHLTIAEYLQSTAMDRDGTWGSAIEIACLSHMLNVQYMCTMFNVQYMCTMYHMKYQGI